MGQYDSHVPLAASTPNSTSADVQSLQQENSYWEIIPGIPQGSLYPTLSSLSSEPVASATNERSLRNRVIKGLNQYLPEAQQLRDSEDNYFDGITRSTNTSPMLEVEEQVDQILKKQFILVKQQSLDVTGSTDNIPESQMTDTGYPLQQPVIVNSIAHVDIDLDVNLLDDQLQLEDGQDFIEEDTLVPNPDAFNDEYHSTTTDDTGECTTIQVHKPITKPPTMDKVSIPTEKVGCIFVTNHLHKYLDKYP